MIDLQLVAELDVSAASGLVATRDALHVVADDETFLAVYDHTGAPLRRVALFDSTRVLPEAHAARKRAKPDLEALAQLPDGRLLALGSGSTPARRRAALIDPARAWQVQTIELDSLYAELARTLPELNIEGAVVWRDALWLAQRGNGAHAQNACIELDLAQVLASLASDTRALPPAAVRVVHPVALGMLAGVPLGLTDLAAHDTLGLMFSAAAEASGSTYDDAPTAGSVIGVLSATGEVLRTETLSPTCKIEGLAVTVGATDRVALWLVADPDDRSQRAPLFSATFK